MSTIAAVKERLNPDLKIAGLALTMVDNRTMLARDVEEEIRKHFPELTFKTIVPRNVRLAEAPSHGVPVSVLDPKLRRIRRLLLPCDGGRRTWLRRRGLGRGLAALLGEEGEAALCRRSGALEEHETASSGGVIDLPVNQIRRNPRQPRRAIDAAPLDELATSIAAVGMVQPVIVRAVEGGYELIAGERRWRAAQKAGFTVIPAIVRTASDVESLELALVENVVRQQLNPVDEAYALKVLLEDLGVTQESLAARVGKSRSAIANKVRLLDLPAAVQESLASGALERRPRPRTSWVCPRRASSSSWPARSSRRGCRCGRWRMRCDARPTCPRLVAKTPPSHSTLT